MEFYVTTNGTTTLSQLFVIEPALVYSTTAIQAFNSSRVSGNAGNVRDFRLTTATVDRWRFIANATAESGSNAGSNFEIRRYSDAGADLGIALSIDRATGVTTLNANKVNLSTAITGITASGSAGTMGDIAWDDTYLYVRISTGWRRIALGGSF